MGRLILLLVMGCVAGFVYAIQHLPWWGVALMFAGVILAVPLFLKFVLRRLILMPFRAKGAVLRGADARVHSIQPAEAPRPEVEEAEEADEPRDWYLVDATIVPKASKGAFAHWAAGEVDLAPPDFRPDDIHAKNEHVCRVERIEVEEEGQFRLDEGMKYSGPRRIRMLVGIRRGVNHLKFQYYFELFGDVRPGARCTAAPA